MDPVRRRLNAILKGISATECIQPMESSALAGISQNKEKYSPGRILPYETLCRDHIGFILVLVPALRSTEIISTQATQATSLRNVA